MSDDRLSQIAAQLHDENEQLAAENQRLRTMVAKMWYTDAPFVTANGTPLLTPEEERLAAEWVVAGWQEADQREAT